MNNNTSNVFYNGSRARHKILVFSWYPALKTKFLRKLGVKISLCASLCSNQGLTGEPHTSFPTRLRSVLRWKSKHDPAGRLRWTPNRAKLPFTGSSAGSRPILYIYIYISLYIRIENPARRRDLERLFPHNPAE